MKFKSFRNWHEVALATGAAKPPSFIDNRDEGNEDYFINGQQAKILEKYLKSNHKFFESSFESLFEHPKKVEDKELYTKKDVEGNFRVTHLMEAYWGGDVDLFVNYLKKSALNDSRLWVMIGIPHNQTYQYVEQEQGRGLTITFSLLYNFSKYLNEKLDSIEFNHFYFVKNKSDEVLNATSNKYSEVKNWKIDTKNSLNQAKVFVNGSNHPILQTMSYNNLMISNITVLTESRLNLVGKISVHENEHIWKFLNDLTYTIENEKVCKLARDGNEHFYVDFNTNEFDDNPVYNSEKLIQNAIQAIDPNVMNSTVDDYTVYVVNAKMLNKDVIRIFYEVE